MDGLADRSALQADVLDLESWMVLNLPSVLFLHLEVFFEFRLLDTPCHIYS